MLAHFDLLIRGGTIVDGSGAPARSGDVGVEGDVITGVGDLSGAQAANVLDAAGLTVMPGIIDCHAHSDLNLLADPRGVSKLQQGVTTELNGQCGMSPFPVHQADRDQLSSIISFITAPVEWTWQTPAEYLDRLESARPAYSAAAMVGHSALRAWAMGFDNRVPTADELEVMCDALRECFDAGCIGVSFGMAYALGSFAGLAEVEALCHVAAERERLVSIHLRDEGVELLEAIREFTEMAGRAGDGLRVQIDHLKCSGERAWGQMDEALALIERQRDAGLDLAFDSYPYTAGSRHLSGSLPGWVHAGGGAKMLERIAQPETRQRLRADLKAWQERRTDYNPFELPFEQIVVTGVETEANQGLVGKNLERIASERGNDPLDVALDLLLEEEGHVNAVFFSMSEEDVKKALAHPLGCVCTDGLAYAPEGPVSSGSPHPRSYGTYPRLLGKYVREEGLLSLEEAVRKATSWPAVRIGAEDRGLIAPGKRADLVVFNAGRIIDTATYAEPHQFPAGIEWVIVAGQVAVHATRQAAERHGEVLRA